MDFVTIRTFQNSFSAHIMLTKFRDAGLECYLNDEFLVTIDPVLSNAIGGIKLVVKKQDLEKAEQMLHDFDESYRRNAVCPRCGSRTIERVHKQSTPNMITAFLIWLFGGYAISTKDVYKCTSCGYESDHLPQTWEDDAHFLSEDTLN
jgi:DNA-directed RNA polymerase subunit RPC12/RpoP